MPYTCTNHEGTPAVLLVTNLTDGDTVALCAEDIHPWAAAIAAATDPEAVQEAQANDPERQDGQDAPEAAPGTQPGTDPGQHDDPNESRPAQAPDPDPASTPDTPVVYPEVTDAPPPERLDPDYPAPSDPAKVAPRDDPAEEGGASSYAEAGAVLDKAIGDAQALAG